MKQRVNIALLALVVFTALFAAACPKRTSIADIEADPSRFNNKTVSVAGTVTDSWGLNIPGTPIRGGAYKISDGTGSLWILTERAVPNKGAQVGVKGRVGNGISWQGKNYGLGMYESDRKFRKR